MRTFTHQKYLKETSEQTIDELEAELEKIIKNI